MALGKKTGGRKKGTPNKATLDVREMARKYGPEAINELARLASEAENEQSRIAACKEILDRAYGKSTQVMEHTGKEGESLNSDVDDRDIARRVAHLLTSGVQECQKH